MTLADTQEQGILRHVCDTRTEMRSAVTHVFDRGHESAVSYPTGHLDARRPVIQNEPLGPKAEC
jgi:hypothetical protein